MKFFLAISIFGYSICITDLLGQTINSYGGAGNDSGSGMDTTSDGGYIVVGTSNSFAGAGGNDVYVIKYESDASIEWSSVYGGAGNDEGKFIQATRDGGYILIGNTASFGGALLGMQAYIIKLTSTGVVQWARHFGGGRADEGFCIRELPGVNQGYVFAGRTQSFGTGQYEGFICRIDNNGNFVWSNSIGTSFGDWIANFIIGNDEGLIFAGASDFRNANYDAWIFKISLAGNLIWSRIIGSNDNDGAEDVISINNNTGYAITGHTRFTPNNMDFPLIILNNNGSLISLNTYGTNGDDRAYTIIPMRDGMLIGGYSTNTGNQNVLLVRLLNNGNIVYSGIYGGNGNDRISYADTVRNKIILVGNYIANPNGSNIIIQNLSDNTNLNCPTAISKASPLAIEQDLGVNINLINLANFFDVSTLTSRNFVISNDFQVNECISLPVIFAEFDVKLDIYPRVKWSVTCDEKHVVFIERSIDGVSFSEIKRIESSPSLNEYQDFTNYENESYYRIKILTKSGDLYYSDIKSYRYDELPLIIITNNGVLIRKGKKDSYRVELISLNGTCFYTNDIEEQDLLIDKNYILENVFLVKVICKSKIIFKRVIFYK